MKFQLLPLLVILFVLHTKHCRANSVEDYAASDSNKQTLIKEKRNSFFHSVFDSGIHPQANESVTAIRNFDEDYAASDSDDQTLINEYPKANESVTAIRNPVEDYVAIDSDNQTLINVYPKTNESVATIRNPVEDNAASDYDNQTLINEYPKANESVTAIRNPVEDYAASDSDDQTLINEYPKANESVTAIRNPVEDYVAFDSDNQTLINVYPKTNESVATIMNPVEDNAASDYDNQTLIVEYPKDYESVIAILDDCIRKFKIINLEGIEGITKEDKSLYQDSMKKIINARKELEYNHINLKAYTESTIDAVDVLFRLINMMDSNQSHKLFQYIEKKVMSLIDKSRKIQNNYKTDIDVNTSDMKNFQPKMESLKKNKEEEKDKFEREQCTNFGLLGKMCNNKAKRVSLTRQIKRITVVLEGFPSIPEIKETNDDVSRQLMLVIKKWVQTRNSVEEGSIYAEIQGNKQDILSQLTILKKACQNYISNAMQNKNKRQEDDNSLFN